MTLAMPDSVTVADLPPGYPAYLGYLDGRYDTAAELAKAFPKAELVLLTVTGQSIGAHGARVLQGTDAEPSDLTAVQALQWVLNAIAIGERPVVYASVQGAAGYGMGDVIRLLPSFGLERDEVRLLSAHYGFGPHICGPAPSCGLISVPMDGTQWTTMAKGLNGSDIDMSMLADDFFAPAQTETERIVGELGIVRQGQRGGLAWVVQGALCRCGQDVAVDGVFGPETAAAVRVEQQHAGITVDGVVGPQTWPVLLGVA
jgi:Putative peptidoglycan binding domain